MFDDITAEAMRAALRELLASADLQVKLEAVRLCQRHIQLIYEHARPCGDRAGALGQADAAEQLETLAEINLSLDQIRRTVTLAERRPALEAEAVSKARAEMRERCAQAIIEHDHAWGRGDRYGETLASVIRAIE